MRLKLILSIGIFVAGQSLAQIYTIEGDGDQVKIKSGKHTIQFADVTDIKPSAEQKRFLIVPHIRFNGAHLEMEPIPNFPKGSFFDHKIIDDVIDVSLATDHQTAASIYSNQIARIIRQIVSNQKTSIDISIFILQPFHCFNESGNDKFLSHPHEELFKTYGEASARLIQNYRPLRVTFQGIAKALSTEGKLNLNIIKPFSDATFLKRALPLLLDQIKDGHFSSPSNLVDESISEAKLYLDFIFKSFQEAGLGNILNGQLEQLRQGNPSATKYDLLISFIAEFPSTLRNTNTVSQALVAKTDILSLEEFEKAPPELRAEFLRLRLLNVSVNEAARVLKK